jgi:hypothetical protein
MEPIWAIILFVSVILTMIGLLLWHLVVFYVGMPIFIVGLGTILSISLHELRTCKKKEEFIGQEKV